jgi:hypothetical protein
MAGSIGVTVTDIGNGLTKYSIAWTSSSGGAVSGASFQMKTGHVEQIRYVPGSGVSADYAASLLDADGIDLFAATGSSLAATASVVVPVISSNSPILNDATLGSPPGSVTPTLSAAGNAKSGRIDVIVGP